MTDYYNSMNDIRSQDDRVDNNIESEVANDATFNDNVDNIFNNLLDDLYQIVEKETTKLSNGDITKMIDKFVKSQNIKKDKNIELILNVIEQYAYYYVMIYVSHRVKDYTQFVMSFNKDAIFNSIATQGKQLYDQILYLCENDEHIRAGNVIINSTYNDAVNLYNNLGDEVTSNIKSKDVKHAVLKYILYTEFFIQKHKTDLYAAIEILEFENTESNMIEIVESTTDVINYTTIEKLFSDENDDVFTDEIYKMLTGEDREETVEDMTLHDKISLMFKKNILIPITDDFLRYNKSTEIYDKGTNNTAIVRGSKKSNTKIKYILSRMNDVLDYRKTKNDDIFYGPLKHRRAVVINNIEELDIIKKLGNVHNKTDEQSNQLEDLLALRKYPFQSFRDMDGNGFTIYTKGTVNAIRYSNIEFLEKMQSDNEFVDWRIINEELRGDVVGVAISGKSDFSSAVDRLSNIKVKNNNPITSALQRIKKQIISDEGNDKIYYWIFNKTNDFDKRFTEIDSLPQDEHYMHILEYLFTEISNITYEKIINTLSNIITDNSYELFCIAESESKRYLPLTSEKRNELCNYIYSRSNQDNTIRDEKEDFIPGLKSELIPLTQSVITKKYVNVLSQYDLGDEEEGDIYNNCQCQHLISWNSIRELRKKHPNKFNDRLLGFINEFVIENSEKDLICKSCGQIVDIKRYIGDWTSSTDEGIALTLSLQTSLENMVEYEKYNVAIKNIAKIIEKLSSTSGIIHLVGANINNEFKRQNIIKIMIDLIDLQNEKMKILNSEKTRRIRLEEAVKHYNISPQYTQFFLFELKNEIFTFSSVESDKFKKQKINNIVAYIILMLILEINTNIIKGFPNDKVLNYYVFEKVGLSLFNDINIRINTAGDIVPITNYKLLCFSLFFLSGMTIKYNAWFNDQTDKKSIVNAHGQKSIIYTCVDMLNDILESSVNSNKYAYGYFSKKFFITLRKNYDGVEAIETIKQLKENIDKKIAIGSTGKLVFKIVQEKEMELRPYTEQTDFGYTDWPDVKGHNMNSFRDTINKSEVFSEAEYQKMLAKGKMAKPVPKIARSKKYIPMQFEGLEFEDYYNTIEECISKWESIIGEDTKINGENMYLKHDVYKINHDYRGNRLDTTTIFTSKDKILSFKKQDPHFLVNVYFYHNKENNVYMYYNAITYEYLGYRSGNNYVSVFGSNCNLEPRFSVRHMLMFLGHSNIQYSLSDDLKEIIKEDINIENYKLHKFISDIIKLRINNMKNALILTQQILNQLITDKKHKTELVAIKYYKKLKNVVTRDKNGKIFTDINEVMGSTFYKKIPTDIKVTFDKDYLYAGNIIKLKNADQDLILYFCKEFNRFIDMNSNVHNKITIINLLSSIVDDEYHRYTYRETSMTYSDVKRFVKMESNLYSKFERDDVDVFSSIGVTEVTDEDKAIKKEQDYDEQEERDAIDIDIDPDDDADDANEQLADTYRGQLL